MILGRQILPPKFATNDRIAHLAARKANELAVGPSEH